MRPELRCSCVVFFLILSGCISGSNSGNEIATESVQSAEYNFSRRPALSDAQKELQGGAESYHRVSRGSNIVGASVFFGAACLALGCDVGETIVSMDIGANVSASTNGRTVSGLDERFSRATYDPNGADLNYLEEMASRAARNLSRAIRKRDEIIADDLVLVRAIDRAVQSGAADRRDIASHARSAFDDLRAMDHLMTLANQRLTWLTEAQEIFAADGWNTRRLEQNISELRGQNSILSRAREILSGHLNQMPGSIQGTLPESRLRLKSIQEN